MSIVIDEEKLSKELIDNFYEKKLIGSIKMKHIILSIPIIILISFIMKGKK